MTIAPSVDERWLRLETYPRRWKHRARVAARMIRNHKWVCDIGAGREHLSDYLSSDAIYLPADVQSWHPGVEKCDLNTRQLPVNSQTRRDVAVLLGVIQIVQKPAELFVDLVHYAEYLLVSHHSVDRDPGRTRKSDKTILTEAAMRGFLHEAGNEILAVETVRNQTLYYCRNTNFSELQDKRRAASWSLLSPSFRQRFRRLLAKVHAI